MIRFDYVEGKKGFEPTLLIKANTLLLKYIVQGVDVQIIFMRMENRLLYAIRLKDDDIKPCFLWSILEREGEKKAIIALSKAETCEVFLFNELAINVAWASKSVIANKNLTELTTGIVMGPVDYNTFKIKVSTILDQLHNGKLTGSEVIVKDLTNSSPWNPISNNYITSHATASPIELFDSDEGGQQEQMAIWLTDNLHPLGVYLSPQIPKDKGFRELTDVLLSYQFGSILIESKSLTIFGRETIPNRTKLARDLLKHIKKAVNQLKGGIRQLRNGVTVTSTSGFIIDVERTQPVHAIVMVPDLDLIEDRKAFGLSMIEDFFKDTHSFIHLVDIAELLRIVQAAEIIASHGKQTTPMMAFDYYLIERAKKSYDAGTLCIEVLLRGGE
ncbi:MAG: hypothetical protein WC770_09135 [Phycisphaerae bacterium]|jgi:hypothetical protein